MDKKYVAYADLLGFSHKIRTIDHIEAKELIKHFAILINDLWETQKLYREDFQGNIFSDCVVIACDYNRDCLVKLTQFMSELFMKSIIELNLMLKGSITEGNFSREEKTRFGNLQNGLIVGSGVVEAYALGEHKSIRGSIITISQNVRDDLVDSIYSKAIYPNNGIPIDGGENNEKKTVYKLKWAEIDYLSNQVNLNMFIRNAVESKWLDHYYGTLNMFAMYEDSEKRRNLIKSIIINQSTADRRLFIENFYQSSETRLINTLNDVLLEHIEKNELTIKKAN